MPTGTSIVASTSPAIRSPANQAAWYSLRICNPGSQRFQPFIVSGRYSTAWSSEILVLMQAFTYQHAVPPANRQREQRYPQQARFMRSAFALGLDFSDSKARYSSHPAPVAQPDRASDF